MLSTQTFITAAILLALGACAGHSTRDASFANRGDYISDVNKSLDNWDKRTKNMSAEEAAKLRASVADARVDVRSLESASEGGWYDQRRKVDEDLARIRNQFGLAE